MEYPVAIINDDMYACFCKKYIQDTLSRQNLNTIMYKMSYLYENTVYIYVHMWM